MRRGAAILAAALALLCGVQAAAGATNEEVRAEVAAHDSKALYPTSLPARLQGADASFHLLKKGFTVDWDRGCCDEEDVRYGYVQLSRFGASRLKKDIEYSRSRGFKPRKVKVGKRTVWYLCGHVCGYEFTRGKHAYGVFGIYYTENERTVEKDMRYVVKALAPVGEAAAE